MKAYNFNAGPCVLPKQAIESAIEAIRDFDNTGIGILEISHRTPGWERIMAETEQLWRELLNIPEDYAVMFLGGGASTQFFEVPANLLKDSAIISERFRHEQMRRNSSHCIVPVTHFHNIQRDFLHYSINTVFIYCNPVTNMNHIVSRKLYARNKPHYRVLEDQ